MISEAVNIDCMEYMARFPDKFFDLAIVDPPYGINYSSIVAKNSNKKTKRGAAWKSNHKIKDWDCEPPKIQYFKELFRISKNQIIWGANHFINRIPISSPCWIVWDKNNGTTKFADCELAWTSFKSPVRKFKYTWNGMIQENMKLKEKRFHPTQKPVQLYRWIIRNYAPKGSKIIDTHLGSGSNRIAAFIEGYDFYSCELDSEYFNAQESRFKTHISQLSII